MGGGDYSGNGFLLHESHNNVLIGNMACNHTTASGSACGNGILLDNFGADDNIFIQNCLHSNAYGVRLIAGTSNLFLNNLLCNNTGGALLDAATGTIEVGTIYDCQIDSDGDGLLNGEEFLWRTDFLQPDSDYDDLDDGSEVANGTDPLTADTDGDGLADGMEVLTLGTNATNQDTDGDGLDDAAELLIHRTNPIVSDSDGDGSSDGAEVSAGTDPLNPSDYPGKTTPPDYLVIILLVGIGALGALSILLFLKNRKLSERVPKLEDQPSKQLPEKPKK